MLLHLVRHGRPLVDPATPARDWALDPAGLPEVDELRARLPASAHGALWCSSDERKALGTARRLTDSPVEVSADLREAGRTGYLPDRNAFVGALTRALAAPAAAALPGWEPLARTRQRVTAAVTGLTARATGDLVLVGHGTAWTLLLGHLLDEPLPDRLPPMRMPDLVTLDLSTRTVLSGWGGWRTP